eukprot:Plantae.Rhodophyta-Palmaria_palmata.ctg12784.p2 GENE.Plantae.Rhodophyta-Palmaria_palmata.ctg12784~~Plantae.Rhodophyta-Palmaria_palmata.ctg12784.p2  ORF type:complete len:103 (-),score=15.41 Plantae.Rhodophyta-Palmaria_palmata.ctg12784:113-421(-)
MYVDQDTFMSELSKLYTKKKTNGSVWVTAKRVTRPVNTGKRKLDLEGPVCIFRATDGKKKVACAVAAGDHVRFHMELFTVIKASTEALKKPKRSRRVKSAAA